MGDVIRDWLRNRLGVIIDLSPEIFGHYARDGTLLAKVLHSYDIINDSQLSTLIHTQDPALARVNLKHLRIWLRFIGVDCDHDAIEDISNGKGTTSLRLFYKVFLCLENKDRLHFITLQNEREKYIPSSSKFDVTTVSEEPEVSKISEIHPLAGALRTNYSLVDWKRKKYEELIDNCRTDRDKFRASQQINEIEKVTSGTESKTVSTTKRRVKSLLEEAENKELDEFARKHRVKETQEIEDPCEDIVKQPSSRKSKIPHVDHDAARAYTKSLRSKHRQEELMRSFKTRLQKTLLTELWDKVLDDQEMEFDEIVAKKVLHQSQYEKQMMRKLYEVRNQKMRMAANREIVEELLEKTREIEMRREQERAREVLIRESEEVEAENQRMNELERRIEEQRMGRKREKLERMGKDVVNDLIDISIMMGEYKMSSNDENIQKSLLNEWKALFFKGLPIFEASRKFEHLRDDYGEEEINEDIEEEDETRIEILNDEDFDNYHNMRLPWQDFIPTVDKEVREYLNLGLVVLGYIVHKILESLYPNNREIFKEPIPRMKVRAVILDLPGTLLYEPIQELLRNKKIRLVRMEEAINYCLECYKEEMKDFEYVDLEIIAATKETLNPSAGTSDAGERVKRGLKKTPSSRAKTVSSFEKIEKTKNGIDKVTQTPRVIPHEDLDPSLSDAAYIGKWTHEFLTLGEPISDELSARIIVEYLKSLRDIEGFVLVNYPTTYSQMSSLEFSLSGRKLPNDDNKFSNERDEICIDEIDLISSRIIYEDEENDSLTPWKRSRLVPNPIESLEYTEGKTYFTGFVRIKPKPKDFEHKMDDDIWEIIGDDATSIDVFYVDQEIASILYYANFDLTTLKRLVRLVIAGSNETISRISSGELFGEVLNRFEVDKEEDSSSSKAPIIKRLLSRPVTDSSNDESEISRWNESKEEIDRNSSISKRSKDSPPLPGETEWLWANFPQNPKLIESLVNLWQNLEISYIENMKNLLYLKRTNFEGQIPYKNFVTRHMREFIERPDKKQDLLHEFHRAFNDIDEDIRDDDEVKNELYCRIDDFQMRLWEICDFRRREAEEERKRIIMENWTTVESIILANVYIGILQAEIDRSNDTLQFIQDYYISMLQRPLQEIRSSVTLKKINIDNQIYTSRQEIVSTGNASTKSIKETKESRQNVNISKIPQVPSVPDENLFREETTKFLINVNNENIIPTRTICYKTIEANIRYVEIILELLASTILDILKKEETINSKTPIDQKEKKGSSKKISRSSGIEQSAEKKIIQDLILEWRYAIMFELNRNRFRLKMLEASAKADVDFLFEGMRQIFFGIERNIIDRYEREVKSINEMVSTFRFAVEEAKPIQEEMLLDADRFIVRSNVLMFPDKPEPVPLPIREEILSSRFRIGQLGRLMDIFRRLSPSGNLPERSFVYLIQDLIVCDEDQEYTMLPPSWLNLRACDVSKIVNELFRDDELIDWREFLIYAMEIESPSIEQLLDVLESFMKIDKKCERFVSWDEYRKVKFWFFDENENEEGFSNLAMHENFEKNEKDFYEEEMMEKCDWNLGTKPMENEIEGIDTRPEEKMRLTMAKKLLFEMFSENCQRVNYFALLIIFCKDEKPELGLGKALSLAIGNKVCIDWNEGEEYVRELIEKKIHNDEARLSGNYISNEVSKTSGIILNSLLKGAFRTSQATASTIVDQMKLKPEVNGNNHRRSIRIEKLDIPKNSLDPANLLTTNEKTSLTNLSDNPKERNRGVSVTISLPRENETKKYLRTDEGGGIVYWLSRNICQIVLAAMLPSHATQPDILESGKNLRENLDLVYLDLRDENLNDDDDAILAHRFINHDFVKKLISDTSKFTIKHLGKIVDKIIRNNKNDRKISL